MCKFLSIVLLAFGLLGCAFSEVPASHAAPLTESSYVGDKVAHFGFGTTATQEQIAAWDIDIRPDGQGLPVGSGSVEDGEYLYEEQCAECHGSFGEGVGRYPVLAGGEDTLTDDRPSKTVGSYWPYTSTLYDYIYRAMPFTQPESLSVDETYALTAYVLYLNDLVEDDLVLDQMNLATIRLPNEANFVSDPRPDVENVRCMNDCRDPAAIKILSEVASTQTTSVAATTVANNEIHHPGRSTYEQYCSICHKVGVGGAPIVGDLDVWQSRIVIGMTQLVHNAVNGTSSDAGVMPAKGGFVQLTDDEVKLAVEYMVGDSS